ncbi:hypothetical protein QE152_g32253 [Popillia japonica]|uniref:Uncharacterized protein n=1 Tax=Popillia japonica TaxID=7064 RepID=A0AAW1J0A2_POPJA
MRINLLSILEQNRIRLGNCNSPIIGTTTDFKPPRQFLHERESFRSPPWHHPIFHLKYDHANQSSRERALGLPHGITQSFTSNTTMRINLLSILEQRKRASDPPMASPNLSPQIRPCESIF